MFIFITPVSHKRSLTLWQTLSQSRESSRNAYRASIMSVTPLGCDVESNLVLKLNFPPERPHSFLSNKIVPPLANGAASMF